MIELPGLIDPHVHLREPGATHKEDWESGTAAALAGGYTMVLAMPNTQPPITDLASLHLAFRAARQKARCDYGQFLGAGPENAKQLREIAAVSAGLKMYLDQTYGPLRLDDMILWMEHFKQWPTELPIAVHAEGRTLAAVILLSALFDRPVHLCHISRREEILLVKVAKEKGVKITCEVTPHHLFLTEEDIPTIGAGRSEVRPRLATAADRDALWENFEVIDCIATDHAPHTLQEKESPEPPPGFPGLETSLGLLLPAVRTERITFEDLILRMHTNPRRIFNLPRQAETWVEVDPDVDWEIRARDMHTRCGWTPFEGWHARGRVRRVVLRGYDAFKDAQILVPPGFGRNVRGDLIA